MKIGEIIKKVFDETGMGVGAFAKKINLTRGTVYNIFERDSIDTELLEAISIALKHDFFRYYDPLGTMDRTQQNLLQEPEVRYIKKREEILTKHIEELEKKLQECEKKNKNV